MSSVCWRMVNFSKSNNISKTLGLIGNNSHLHSRFFSTSNGLFQDHIKQDSNTSSSSTELATTEHPKAVFEKEFPSYYHEGKFTSRISYVDFIDEALEKMQDLGLDKNMEAYKELLRVFPPGKYGPSPGWKFGLFHAPQQLAALRILCQMEMNGLRYDKEVEQLIVDAFSKTSDVWLKVGRGLYWGMKGRNVDPSPVPEKLPTKPYELAKVALARMLKDYQSIITQTNTSSVSNSIDKTWIVYSQSPTQQAIIEELDEKSVLHIEDNGLMYVGENYLSYFVLKHYLDDDTIIQKNKPPEPDFNYNTCKMQFYGKPIKEKLQSIKDNHFDGSGHILSTCLTGTSSHDSVLSWLKILQKRNPRLKNMSVVFKLKRPTNDIVEYNISDERNKGTSEQPKRSEKRYKFQKDPI